jgi:hypothetical protein
MNSKTMYILVAALVIVIVVAGVGIYLFMGTGGGGGGGGGGGENTYTVANATSLQFSVNETTNGALVTYEFACKNMNDLNTSSAVIRLDIPGGAVGNYSYILNASEQKSWSSTDNGATWTEGSFATDWPMWGAAFNSYVTNLVNWSGTGDYTYTDANGNSNTIYNITVNPTLPDSLFQPI